VRMLFNLIPLAALCASTAVAAGTTKTVVLDVQNLTCELCTVTVKKALLKVSGLEEAKVDYTQKTATIKYNPAKTNATAIAKASVSWTSCNPA
jgi:mercuric ion binding protein